MTRRRRKPPILVDGKETDFRNYVQGDGRGGWLMFFCRGDLGCKRTPVQLKLAKQKCKDCIQLQQGENLEQVLQRMIVERSNGKPN